MATIVETFDAVSVTNASVQFIENGEKQDGIKFGCLGSIAGETEMRELIKRCEGVEVRKRSKPERHNLTLTGHVRVDVIRGIFGLTNDNLKPGVYSYNKDAKGKEFTLTADVIDEFEDVTKMIAFPQCVSATGLQLNIENGADEVAELELEFTSYPDEKGNFYYEAMTKEVDDETVIEKWHTNFDYELVSGENQGGVEG